MRKADSRIKLIKRIENELKKNTPRATVGFALGGVLFGLFIVENCRGRVSTPRQKILRFYFKFCKTCVIMDQNHQIRLIKEPVK